ncbi:MAG: ABC transporter substrate-binding protein, partial [Chloroflexi bacterium]|nr:ABC transporter substrate-binding protein [Chloroflexota bacterium]
VAAAQPAATAVAQTAPTVVAAVQKAASGEPYKIGAVLSISGFNSPLGTPERDTLQMMAEDLNSKGGINGRPLELVVYDSESDNTKAVTLVRRLLDQDRVLAVIGSSASGETLAFSQSIAEAEVPNVALAAAVAIFEPVKKWGFTTASSNLDSAGAIVNYMKAKSMDRVAVLHSTNGFGQDGRAVWQRLNDSGQIKVVATESFTDNDTDMSPQLTKLKGSEAQAIAIWGNNPAQAIVAKNYQQLGLNVPLMYSHSAPNAQFLQQAGDAANGIIMPTNKITVAEVVPANDPQKPVLDAYAQAFRARFNRPADQFGGHAYDAMQMVVDALNRGADTPAKLRDEIESTKNYVGVSGVFNYSPTNHSGMTPDALLMVMVESGRFVLAK